MQNLVVDPVAKAEAVGGKEKSSSSNDTVGVPSSSGMVSASSSQAKPLGGGGGGEKRKQEEEEQGIEGAQGDEEMVAVPVANNYPIPFDDQLTAEVALLESKQLEIKCNTNVVGVLKPYIANCLRRWEAGQRFMNIKEFQKKEKICEKCFHADNGHTRFNCGVECCDVRVCPKCFHSHYGPKCLCGHSQKYLNDLRNRMI